jgi:hypothetical protein
MPNNFLRQNIAILATIKGLVIHKIKEKFAQQYNNLLRQLKIRSFSKASLTFSKNSWYFDFVGINSLIEKNKAWISK